MLWTPEYYAVYWAIMDKFNQKVFCPHTLESGKGYSVILDCDSYAVLVHDACNSPIDPMKLQGINLGPVPLTVEFTQGDCDRQPEENAASATPCCITAESKVRGA